MSAWNPAVVARVQPSAVLSPSILAADLLCLGEQVRAVEDVAAWLHVDVMDNHFVRNIAGGPALVTTLAAVTTLALDCHLMIRCADRFAPEYVGAGASSVTFHAEAARDAIATARAVRRAGGRVGVALNPETPLSTCHRLIEEIDILLVLTVSPGFGGQTFRHDLVPKIAAARQLINDAEAPVRLQVDGGIDETTIRVCSQAGADAFVAGTAVFGQGDAAEAARRLLSRVGAAKASPPGLLDESGRG